MLLLSFASRTRRFSRISGLNRPPVRSLERSFSSFFIVELMPSCNMVKSDGSSPLMLFSEADALACSFASFWPFLWNAGVVEKH